MYPILGRYGSFFLYSYTVVLGVGMAAGLLLTARLAPKISRVNWLDGILMAWVMGLMGGRVGFVWAYKEYFQERPFEIWQLWQGGLSYHGALLAGIGGLAIGYWLWQRSLPNNACSFRQYASLLAPGFILAHAFGWLACWLEGCAYGKEAALGWFTADLPDEFGIFAVRYQTQLMGIVGSLLVLGGVLWLKRPEIQFYATMVGISFGRFFITLYRGDVVPQIGSYRIDTILEAVFVLLFLILLLWRVLISRPLIRQG